MGVFVMGFSSCTRISVPAAEVVVTALLFA